MRTIPLLLLIIVLLGRCHGQTNAPLSAKTVPEQTAKEYCRTITAFVDANDAKKLTFGRGCDRQNDPLAPLSCKWRQFANEKAWQTWIEDNGNYGAVFLWLRDGKVVEANFTFQTPSYDWANLANYCFRPDGSLAVMTTTLNDMNLDVSVHRVALYSPSGSRQQFTEVARSLSTKKTQRIPDDLLQAETDDTSNSGFKSPLFKKASDLPFIDLLPR